MYNEPIEIIKEIDFKELKEKTLFPGSVQSLPEDVKAQLTEQNSKIKESKETEQKLQEELFENSRDLVKQAQERSEKIKQTSICINLVRERGCTRAHVTHRLTHQLLAVIPWYGTTGEKTPQEFLFNDYFSSFYANMSMGAQVDKQI